MKGPLDTTPTIGRGSVRAVELLDLQTFREAIYTVTSDTEPVTVRQVVYPLVSAGAIAETDEAKGVRDELLRIAEIRLEAAPCR
jgi:hypothetical protein